VFIGTNPTDEPITSGLPLIECLLEAARSRSLTDEAQRRWSRDSARQVQRPGAAFRDIVFRSPTLPFLGRRIEEYGLSDGQSTDVGDRAVDSRVVLVRTNDRLQHFWCRTC
jgi:hypothetical protein